jgi:hypothetical protein
MTKEIETKRQEVRSLYVKYGISPIYEKAFDELHDLNMDFMAEQYRKDNGMLPKPKTPYN